MKTAIIGLGIGSKHYEAYIKSQCDVVAVCELDEQQYLSFKDQTEYRGRFYLDWRDLLEHEELDCISIASYDNFHCTQILASLDKQIHVFVEKPLCLDIEEYVQIAKAINSNPGIILSSNFLLRKAQGFLTLRDQISTGRLGDIYSMSFSYDYGRLDKIITGWRGGIPNYSVMHGGGIHMIDLSMWLIDSSIEEVFAYGNKFFTNGLPMKKDDCVKAILSFSNGVIADLTANFGCSSNHMHNAHVYGTLGTFQQTITGSGYIFGRDPKASITPISKNYKLYEKGDNIPEFIESIKLCKMPSISARDVLRVMAISLAIELSVAEHRPVRVSEIF